MKAFLRRLLGTFHRRDAEAEEEFRKEIEAHLEMDLADFVGEGWSTCASARDYATWRPVRRGTRPVPRGGRRAPRPNLQLSRRASLVTLAGATLARSLPGVIACWLPARRATRVDPASAIRSAA